jgi:hypothetical protein
VTRPRQWLLLLTAAWSLSGCLLSQWVVGVVNATDQPFLVRVELPDGTTDFLALSHAEGTVVAQRDATLPARVKLVDPETCHVLDEVELGSDRTWIGITPEPLALVAEVKRNLAADDVLLAADTRCLT